MSDAPKKIYAAESGHWFEFPEDHPPTRNYILETVARAVVEPAKTITAVPVGEIGEFLDAMHDLRVALAAYEEATNDAG